MINLIKKLPDKEDCIDLVSAHAVIIGTALLIATVCIVKALKRNK
jgi:hypothetical protein